MKTLRQCGTSGTVYLQFLVWMCVHVCVCNQTINIYIFCLNHSHFNFVTFQLKVYVSDAGKIGLHLFIKEVVICSEGWRRIWDLGLGCVENI